MEEYLPPFLAWLGDVSPYTRRTYTNDLRHFIRWYADRHAGAPPRITDLTPITLVLYKAALADKLELRPSSVKRRLSTLMRFGQWAAEQGYIEALPPGKVKIPPVPRTPPRRLDAATARALLRAAQEDRHALAGRNAAILWVLAEAGIRAGALVALRRADVGWDGAGRAVLTVQDGRRRAPRAVTLSAAASEALRRYLDAHPAPEDAPLFRSTRGRAMHTETVRHVLNKYAARLGLDPAMVSPDALRHALTGDGPEAGPGG
ncbi:MAG: hypothetical protein Kow0077_28550 [Anaerolineae bacterium]